MKVVLETSAGIEIASAIISSDLYKTKEQGIEIVK